MSLDYARDMFDVDHWVCVHTYCWSFVKKVHCRKPLVAAVLSIAEPVGPCLRGICDESAAETTIVISTMYSAAAQWYTEEQAKRFGDDHDKRCKQPGDKTMMRTVRLPLWPFLLWSELAYVWGLLGYFGAGWGTDCHRLWGVAQACYNTFFPALNASSFQPGVGPDFSALLIFTVCVMLYCFLCSVALSMKIERRLYWLACLLQGGLVLIAKLAIQGGVGAFGDGIAL